MLQTDSGRAPRKETRGHRTRGGSTSSYALPDAVPIRLAAEVKGIGIHRLRRLWDAGDIPRVSATYCGKHRCVPKWWVLDDGRGLTDGDA